MKVTRSARKSLRTGVRWKKGQSSSSNPRCVRFREAASSGRARLADSAPGAGITTADLRRFDQRANRLTGLDSRRVDYDDNDDNDTIDNDDVDSVATWATNFTGCTNQCFGQLVANWSARTNSAASQSALAVLAAVTQIIKESGGRETNEEYMQALLTAVASVEPELRPTAAYLLCVLMRRTESSSVAAAFAPIAKVCQSLLGELAASINNRARGENEEKNKVEDSEHSAAGLCKSLLLCLGRGLACLPRSAWHSASTRQAMQSLLVFSQSERPSVRKAALLAAADACSACQGSFRAASAQVAAFGCERIDSNSQSAARAARLLAACANCYGERQAKTIVERLLGRLPMSDSALFVECLRTMRSLFWAWPNSGLPCELCGQSLTALYDSRPAPEDPGSVNAWLETMRAGAVALATAAADSEDSRADEVATAHLTKLFASSFNLLAQCRPESRDACCSTCHHLLTDLFGRCARPQALATQALLVIQSGLSYQFRPAWQQVAHLLAAFFRCYGVECDKAEEEAAASVSECVAQLAGLRDSVDDGEKEAVACLEGALASALEELGPRRFLSSSPLSVDPDRPAAEWTRAWLLPLLRRHARKSELLYFASDLLPLADRCADAAKVKEEANELAVAKQLRLLESQIWQTLPAFCSEPSDLGDGLRQLARRLGQLLMTRPDLRQWLLAGLRRLLSSGVANDAELLRSYAKNFMPRLFNLYCSPEEPLRLSVLETVRAYAPLCPGELLTVWFEKMREKATDDKSPESDLMVAMATSLPDAALSTALSVCSDWCLTADKKSPRRQKKGYRMLQELLKEQRNQPRESLAKLLGVSAPEILLAGQDSAVASSKKSRLRCLALLIDSDWLPMATRQQLAERALPEAVLATGELNCKARESADTAVLCTFKLFASVSDDNEAAAVRFLSIVFASSEDNEESLASSLRAVSGLLPQLKLLVTPQLAESLLRRLRDTLTRPDCSRQLAKSCIRCLLTVCRRLSHAYTLEQMSQTLNSVPQHYRLVFRASVRRILTKLYAVFPYEILRSSVPDYCRKALANVRKRLEYRLKRKRLGAEEKEAESVRTGASSYWSAVTRVVKGVDELLESSSSSSLDNDDEEARTTAKAKSARSSSRRRRKLAGERAWLEEGADDILDLKDATAAAKIHRAEPRHLQKSTTKSVKSAPFKLASDGRMIINDDEDDDDKGGASAPASSKRRRTDDDDDDYMDDEEEMGAVDDDDNDDKEGVYKPGGRGIHRPIRRRQLPGAKYASDRAGGDLRPVVGKKSAKKLAGKKANRAQLELDPYSFVQLDRRLLNRRNRSGQKDQLVKYKSLVRRRKK